VEVVLEHAKASRKAKEEDSDRVAEMLKIALTISRG